jgi:hypothetical protein
VTAVCARMMLPSLKSSVGTSIVTLQHIQLEWHAPGIA